MFGDPRRIVQRFLLAGLFAAGILGAGVALANAPSLEVLSGDALTPSEAPSLLGPITESGRTGWQCHPEKAAASAAWQDAELPDRH